MKYFKVSWTAGAREYTQIIPAESMQHAENVVYAGWIDAVRVVAWEITP